MSGLTSTERAQAQVSAGMFRRFQQGATLDEMNLFHDLMIVYNFIEFLRCDEGLQITKNADGTIAVISQDAGSDSESDSGIPEGYEEEELNIITDGKIVKRTVLIKTDNKSDVETWTSSDYRKLLQVDSSGKLTIDKGYLV